MANAWCINAYDCNGCLIQTLQTLDSACIGVGVQYTAPNPLDDKRIDYIQYTDKCWCTCCLSWENEILIYATDWVIKNLTLTNDDVNEAIKIQWNDIFGSNRVKTVVRYKTGSAPVSITDWTLAVEETTKNQYSSTAYSLTGVLDETTYYITAFAVDSNNTVISSQTASVTTDFWWKPSANTLLYMPMETNLTDMSWNWRTASWSNISFTTLWWISCASWNGSNSKVSITPLWFCDYNNDTYWTVSMLIYLRSISTSWVYTKALEFAVQNKTLFMFWWSQINWWLNQWLHVVRTWNKNTWEVKYYINWEYKEWFNDSYSPRWKWTNSYEQWQYLFSSRGWNNNRMNWWMRELIIENKLRSDADITKYCNRIKNKLWI